MIRRSQIRSLTDRRGATAVEFSIVGSALIILLIGILDVGFALFCATDVRHAVERGARTYIATPSATDDQFIAAVASNLILVPSNAVTYHINKTTVSGAPVAQIVWVYDYAIAIPCVIPNVPCTPVVTMHLGSQIDVPLRQS